MRRDRGIHSEELTLRDLCKLKVGILCCMAVFVCKRASASAEEPILWVMGYLAWGLCHYGFWPLAWRPDSHSGLGCLGQGGGESSDT